MERNAALAHTAAPIPGLLHRTINAVQRRRVFRDIFEISLVAIAFLFYFLVRGAVVERQADALRNARHIMDVERAIGIFWEPRLQAIVLHRKLLIDLFDFIYFWLDFPLIVAVGFTLYFFRRHQYTVARDAILLSGAIALVIYNLFPVMPPRLLPGGEFVGTLEKYNQLSYQAQSLKAFVNPYAAVPSLHFGWAMIIGGAIFLATRNPVIRFLGLLLPWAQLAAIIFTANHYILDAFVGLVVCLAGIALAAAMQRWVYPALTRAVERRWPPLPA
ncbi:MAG TPA: phosphatase PAP2 family protein [Dehalococcoidia bacterium]|nr:phosphatase PAP2 family protein [Dehalococcoidia bacterium]